jgi:hypothetical protein
MLGYRDTAQPSPTLGVRNSKNIAVRRMEKAMPAMAAAFGVFNCARMNVSLGGIPGLIFLRDAAWVDGKLALEARGEQQLKKISNRTWGRMPELDLSF